MAKKTITYNCRYCHNNHKVKIKKLPFSMPKNLPDSGKYIINVKTDCGEKNYAQLQFTRPKNFKKRVVDQVDKINIDDFLKNNPDNIYLGNEKINSEQLTYFRPKNKDEALNFIKNKDLLNSDSKIKSKEFNYNGRRGYFFYNSNEVVFVSQTELDENSLEKVIQNYENISLNLIGKKLKAQEKKKEKLTSHYIPFNFVDSPEIFNKLNKISAERKKRYYNNDIRVIDFKNTDSKGIIKKSVKMNLKKAPNYLIRGLVCSMIPGAISAINIYKWAKTANSIKKLVSRNKTIENNEIPAVDEEIDNREVSDYETQRDDLQSEIDELTVDKTDLETEISGLETNQTTLTNTVASNQATMNSFYDLIKPETEGASSLESLDNFFLANGATCVDSDLDGFTDYYELPDGTKITDPFSVIPDGYIPEEDAQAMESAWDNLQEYESARTTYDSSSEDLSELEETLLGKNSDLQEIDNDIIEKKGILETVKTDLQDLIDLYSNKDDLLGEIKENVDEKIPAFKSDMSIYTGIGVSLAIGTAISIGFSVYYSNKQRKLYYGSNLRPLTTDELKVRYAHDYIITPVKLAEQPIDDLVTELSDLKQKVSDDKNLLNKLNGYLSNDKISLDDFIKPLINNSELVTNFNENQNLLEKVDKFKEIYSSTIELLNSNFDNKISSQNDLQNLVDNPNLYELIDFSSLELSKVGINNTSELIAKLPEMFSLYDTQKQLSSQIKDILINKQLDISEEIENHEVELNKKNLQYLSLKEIMFDNLRANPELIKSKNYKGFGKEFNEEIIETVLLNSNDLDKASKKINKMKKKILAA